MTIERLFVQNFQCHEDLLVVFDSDIVTVVGPSDAGKSAILRALRWVAFNRPAGTGFIRRGADGARVRIRVDGRTVERSRNGKANAYRVGRDRFEAFGADVPPAASALLGLVPENFAGQHDPPFWLSLSPPELARELNRVVDLDLIDWLASFLAGRLRALRAEEAVLAGRLAEARREAAAGTWALVADRGLRRLEELEAARAVAEREAAGLADLAGRLREAEGAAGREVPDLSGLESLRVKAGAAAAEAGAMGHLVDELRKIEVAVGARLSEVGKDEVDLARELKGQCPLCGGKVAAGRLL